MHHQIYATVKKAKTSDEPSKKVKASGAPAKRAETSDAPAKRQRQLMLQQKGRKNNRKWFRISSLLTVLASFPFISINTPGNTISIDIVAGVAWCTTIFTAGF